MPPRNVPDRNLALELVRVTEAAALQAARHIGRGDKEAADQAAVDGMHAVLHTIHMDGIVVIGEGEKDEAPMLHNGEQVGDGSLPEVDIAVDPLEGTRLCAQGRPNALAVIALSEKGSMFDPGPCVYMEKMAGGLLVAAADPARRLQRGGLGHAHELEREVAVGRRLLLGHQRTPGGLRGRSVPLARIAPPIAIRITPAIERNQPMPRPISPGGSPGRSTTPT